MTALSGVIINLINLDGRDVDIYFSLKLNTNVDTASDSVYTAGNVKERLGLLEAERSQKKVNH